MITKIDGVIISKHPYRERDLLVRLLLRNGKKITVMFYGGKGGGVRKKSSVLEIGFLIEIELQKNRAETELFTAKEWVLKWHHDLIRQNYLAFCLLCFFSELIQHLATEAEFKNYESEIHHDGDGGLFRVLSNALVYLEKSLLDMTGKFLLYDQVFIFLTKLAVELGIFPESDVCVLCGHSIKDGGLKVLSMEHGGYQCFRCTDLGFSNDDTAIYLKMLFISHKQYRDILLDYPVDSSEAKKVLHYVCYQFNITPETLKTLQSIFN